MPAEVPMSDRKPTSVVMPALVAALVLLGPYVGAYYATVKPDFVALSDPDFGRNAVYPLLYGTGWETDTSKFMTGQARWNRFFAPIHWLDRRIRPHAWEP